MKTLVKYFHLVVGP